MKKSQSIVDIQIHLLKALLNQPFRTALGEHNYLENILVILILGDGTKGFGEAAIASHITGETIPETIQNLKHVAGRLKRMDAYDYLKISSLLHEALPCNKSALAAIEMSLLDALTRQWKMPLWNLFGDQCHILKSDITIVIADLEETEHSVRKYYAQGFRAFKVKVGRDMDLDLKRVLIVHRTAKKSAIYLDANQGYSAEQTLKFLNQLKKYKVNPSLIEQPVPKKDWEGLKKVTRSTRIPVCADESAQNLSDAGRIIKEKAAKIINIKLMKSGLVQAREIAMLAQKNGVGLMIGGMMETSLAMTASAHLAAGLGVFDFVDLDTPFFIKDGLEGNPCLNARGVYDLRGVREGIGVRIRFLEILNTDPGSVFGYWD